MDTETFQLNGYEYTEYKQNDIENNIDPNNNFFNTVQANCTVLTDT